MKNEVRVERARKRMSQEELAKAIGVSKISIFNVENEKYVPSTVMALKLAKFFGKTVNEIFFLEETD